MYILQQSLLLLASASVLNAATLREQLLARQAANNTASANTCLAAGILQKASGLTGQEPGTSGIDVGQAPSTTYVILSPLVRQSRV
jgi:hypothetical protein